jgi:hypothetical protein
LPVFYGEDREYWLARHADLHLLELGAGKENTARLFLELLNAKNLFP